MRRAALTSIAALCTATALLHCADFDSVEAGSAPEGGPEVEASSVTDAGPGAADASGPGFCSLSDASFCDDFERADLLGQAWTPVVNSTLDQFWSLDETRRTSGATSARMVVPGDRTFDFSRLARDISAQDQAAETFELSANVFVEHPETGRTYYILQFAFPDGTTAAMLVHDPSNADRVVPKVIVQRTVNGQALNKSDSLRDPAGPLTLGAQWYRATLKVQRDRAEVTVALPNGTVLASRAIELRYAEDAGPTTRPTLYGLGPGGAQSGNGIEDARLWFDDVTFRAY